MLKCFGKTRPNNEDEEKGLIINLPHSWDHGKVDHALLPYYLISFSNRFFPNGSVIASLRLNSHIQRYLRAQHCQEPNGQDEYDPHPAIFCPVETPRNCP